MDEAAQIRRCRDGDPGAFEPLFRSHVRKAVGLAYLVTRDWALAEDAAQEAFSRAFRSIRSFRMGQPFAPWLYRIVMNEARRAAGRRAPLPVPPLSLEAADPDSPEAILLDRERAAELWQAVHALDAERRTVVLLKYYTGLSELEIAALLCLRQSTVKSRLYVARQRLQAWLKRTEEVERP